ncbi:endonuclease/exonuclease/phosphatase family protein [bacterium]|nr:endonuclease/exonuclease/phosphatase family protein [bacterium]
MIARIEILARQIRRWVSRSEWLVRLGNLSRLSETAIEPGLVIIQIDGLSRKQMEKGMADGEFPFVRGLLRDQHYRVLSHYSGLPSSTPSVQGELHYGVKSVVPAFSFYSRKRKRVIAMYEGQDATEVEKTLAQRGEPLLRDGCSYANIYRGGSAESHYCVPDLDIGHFFRKFHSFHFLFFIMTNFYSLVRVVMLLIIEFGLAIVDCFRGIVAGEDLLHEIKFIPSRAGICVLLRELIVASVKIDLARGAPIIHLNLLGYDEQSHRRGPNSAFAHWGLKGIDDAIERIWRAAERSSRRDYEVWILSDHGQEHMESYYQLHGKSVQQAVAEFFDLKPRTVHNHGDKGIQLQRARLLGFKLLRRLIPGSTPPEDSSDEETAPLVTAMGPLGHIYLRRPLDPTERAPYAERLAKEVGIPLVLCPVGRDQARAWTENGTFLLPEERGKVLNARHPFLDEVTQDLIRICHHSEAGDFVISGYSPNGKSVTFPIENGSHGGPGEEETEGFIMTPEDTSLTDSDKGWVRPLDVRRAAMQLLGREEAGKKPPAPRPSRPPDLIRVLTYNVHTCIGMDGRLSPHRIARVIARYDPDVVALQELDVHRARTLGHDQAEIIARYLQMDHHFYPALQMEEEKYGDALFSRFPMQIIKADGLPGHPVRTDLERRGAIWVRIDVNDRPVHVINTHFGLRPRERLAQAQAMLGPEWLEHEQCCQPVIVCGDFNSLPGSPVHQGFLRKLRDAQMEMEMHRPQKTYFSRYPLGRIDHIFHSADLEVIAVRVARSRLTQVASDHLPLVVELRLPPATDPTPPSLRTPSA